MGEIRFAGTGETHGYPYLVCKKMRIKCIRYQEKNLHCRQQENKSFLVRVIHSEQGFSKK